MSNCCYSGEYGDMFTEGEARRTAKRYGRRGLRGTAGQLASMIEAGGVRDATVMEVGGGVGDLQAHLLQRGAAQVLNVELSPSWEPAARELFDRLALTARSRRVVGDFVDLADTLPDADVVVLHRVICCYPDWQGMLDAATRKSQRIVALTIPVDRFGSRTAVRLGNWLMRLRGRSFQAFVHPPERLIETLEGAGFTVTVDRVGMVWRTIVAGRPAITLA